MNIQVTNNETETVNGRTYTYLNVIVETKEVSVTKAKDYINVIVKNASNKAFRGTGKDFQSFDQAIQNYKDSKIIAAIKTAQELC